MINFTQIVVNVMLFQLRSVVSLRVMQLPTLILILNALYKGFQMNYHLFQKLFGKMIKIKKMSFFFIKCLVSIAHHCKSFDTTCLSVKIIIKYVSTSFKISEAF